MSYILDALQRADAERKLGRVPGLTGQRVPRNRMEPERAAAPRLWRTAAGLIVTLSAIAVWWWAAGPREPQTRPISLPINAPTPPQPMATPSSAGVRPRSRSANSVYSAAMKLPHNVKATVARKSARTAGVCQTTRMPIFESSTNDEDAGGA